MADRTLAQPEGILEDVLIKVGKFIFPGADRIIRRCVPKTEQARIVDKCHSSPYGGHFARDRTGQKILQSGFYWQTLFKYCYEWVKHCEKC